MLSCKSATRLISLGQDVPLTRMQRISLRLHLMMCRGCRNYEKQINLIHKACQRVSGSGD